MQRLRALVIVVIDHDAPRNVPRVVMLRGRCMGRASWTGGLATRIERISKPALSA